MYIKNIKFLRNFITKFKAIYVLRSGALSGKMLLVGNNKIDAYYRAGLVK